LFIQQIDEKKASLAEASRVFDDGESDDSESSFEAD